MAATSVHAEPSEESMRLAYRALRRPTWPDTFEAALQDPHYRALMRGAAARMQRGTWATLTTNRHSLPRPPIPPVPALPAKASTYRPAFDRKRAAANDLED